MKHKLIKTKDGSHTLFVPELNENYHSVNGAVQESLHVFIDAGFQQILRKPLYIFEVGFGTGLNALLTYFHARKSKRMLVYHAIEKYPLNKEQILALNYPDFTGKDMKDVLMRFHECPWEKEIEISPFFILKKIKADLVNYAFSSQYDLVYFDAFAPDVQPGMWQEGIFRKLFHAMTPGSILTTYSAKGNVRRTMEEVGFKVEKLPGPPGKREMLRAARLFL
jgi:tRNA U34 5-methylaminomethyl-2-thiouridine-forming methyltransferase MnmC